NLVIMTKASAKPVSSAMAKAHLSELVAGIAHGGDRYVIQRHGRAAAALVSMQDLERLEAATVGRQARGALALVGAWREVDEREFDSLVADIYRERERDTGRPVELPE
ncbi:MAG: type II toxin-antitoxin system Phd/YefM family antitoxin, partial [Chloroflexota bacterium]